MCKYFLTHPTLSLLKFDPAVTTAIEDWKRWGFQICDPEDCKRVCGIKEIPSPEVLNIYEQVAQGKWDILDPSYTWDLKKLWFKPYRNLVTCIRTVGFSGHKGRLQVLILLIHLKEHNMTAMRYILERFNTRYMQGVIVAFHTPRGITILAPKFEMTSGAYNRIKVKAVKLDEIPPVKDTVRETLNQWIKKEG